MMYSLVEDNVEEATRWASILEEKARQHHDQVALGTAFEFRSTLLESRGDLRGAIPPLQEALALFERIGDVRRHYLCWMRMRRIVLQMGKLQEAEACANNQRQAAEALGDPGERVVAWVAAGAVALCQGRWEAAMDAYRSASRIRSEAPPLLSWLTYASGRASLARGRRSEAKKQFEQALCLHVPEAHVLAEFLSGLEDAWDDPGAFAAFCHCFRAQHPETRDSPFVQWHLEPTESCDFGSPSITSLHAEGWVGYDPSGDGSFKMDDGLAIRAPNGRDLCFPNRSAPRWLRKISGDFAVQAVCRSPSGAAPAIGGLLLWKNPRHYLRLDWGVLGPHHLSLGGCLPEKPVPARMWSGEKDLILGRGRLVAEPIFLRLERLAGWVRALCSADGHRWYLVGETEFRGEETLEVGVHAIGAINRRIYPGAFSEGTAIQFESFALWA
jgi:hypothetical protein